MADVTEEFSGQLPAGSELIERMRGSRNVATVLKVRLSSIRTQAIGSLIFVIEGPEDKTVYFHWLKLISPFIQYEMLVCNGKGKLLALRELLQRDLGTLKQDVYFFVDHDFDGLRGQAISADVYLTDGYSIENHLVRAETLDEILRVDLHCDGEPAVRSVVLSHFSKLYDEFLGVTLPLNERIYIAKRCGIKGVKPWPDKLSLIANVSLAGIQPCQAALNTLVCLEREPSSQEVDLVSPDFAALEKRAHYRGKFAIAFLVRVLQLFAENRGENPPTFFHPLPPKTAAAPFTLDAIASKSLPPESFKAFILGILDQTNRRSLVAT